MKKLIITSLVAFFGFATAAVAQQDTTGYTQDQAIDERNDEINDGQEPGNEFNQDAEPSQQELEDAADEMDNTWDDSAVEPAEEAQEGVDNTGDEIDRIGNTGAAHIKDERLESKEGPAGETVFITEDGQYYYISRETGERVDVDKSELNDKE